VSEERGRDLWGRDDRWDRAVGEREGEGERVGLAWGELGRLASRVRPKWAPGLFLLFIFFLLLFFISVLSF
jgi:hypothetical protein